MHETSVIRIDRKQLKIVPKELKKILKNQAPDYVISLGLGYQYLILGNLLNYICEDSYIFRDYLYGSIHYIHKKYNDIDNIKILREKYTYHEIKELMDKDVNNRVTSIQREYKKIYDFIDSLLDNNYVNHLDKELENIYKIIYNVNTTKQFIENIKNRIDIFLNKTLPDIPVKEYEKSNLKKLFDKFEYKKVEYYA